MAALFTPPPFCPLPQCTQGWVQSYGSRYVRPPIIHADVTFSKPMTVREYAVAQQLTAKPVKGMLTGARPVLSGLCGGAVLEDGARVRTGVVVPSNPA